MSKPPPEPQTVTINLGGDIPEAVVNKFIRDTLIPAINEAASDGVKLKVNERGIDYIFWVFCGSMLVGVIGALAILVMMQN